MPNIKSILTAPIRAVKRAAKSASDYRNSLTIADPDTVEIAEETREVATATSTLSQSGFQQPNDQQ